MVGSIKWDAANKVRKYFLVEDMAWCFSSLYKLGYEYSRSSCIGKKGKLIMIN